MGRPPPSDQSAYDRPFSGRVRSPADRVITDAQPSVITTSDSKEKHVNRNLRAIAIGIGSLVDLNGSTTRRAVAQPQPCGPVEDWPWGQEPATWMLDPAGHLAGPLSKPEGWIAAHRSNIDAANASDSAD